MFRKRPAANAMPAWVIVGLGNPGPEYRGTRHNVGFDVVDEIARRHRIKLDRSRHQARYGVGEIHGVTVALVRPLTYMNLSGRAVAPILKEYGVGPDRLAIVADDLDLPVGRVRLKPKGSAGGHNGHKSLIASLGTSDYPRFKIGIGSVDRTATIGHVLGPFTPDERVRIDAAMDRTIRGLEALVELGLERALNVTNENP